MPVDGLVQHDISDLAQVRRQGRPAKGENHNDQPDRPQHAQKPETGIRLWDFGLLVHARDSVQRRHGDAATGQMHPTPRPRAPIAALSAGGPGDHACIPAPAAARSLRQAGHAWPLNIGSTPASPPLSPCVGTPSQIIQRRGIARTLLDGRFIRIDGAVEFVVVQGAIGFETAQGMRIATVEVRLRICGTTLEGAIKGRWPPDSAPDAAKGSHVCSAPRPNRGMCYNLFEALQGSFRVILAHQQDPHIKQGEDIIRVQREGLAALLYSLVPPPLLAVDNPHAGIPAAGASSA